MPTTSIDRYSLNPIDLLATSLGFQARAWSIPVAHHFVGIATFTGLMGGSTDIESDLRFMRFMIREMATFNRNDPSGIVSFTFGGLIVDVTGLTGTVVIEESLFPHYLRGDGYPCHVVTSPSAIVELRGDVEGITIGHDLIGALGDIAFRQRAHRPDGGKGYDSPRPIPPHMMELAPVSLDIGKIDVEPFVVTGPAIGERTSLLRISGEYPHGSAGRNEARLISWRLAELRETTAPTRLVVDLRNLDYQWGDDLDLYPAGFLPGTRAARFVVNIFQNDARALPLDERDMYPDLESALDLPAPVFDR